MWIQRPNRQLSGRRRIVSLAELKRRIRDVRQGPDALIYLLTEEVNGGVFRLEPAG